MAARAISSTPIGRYYNTRSARRNERPEPFDVSTDSERRDNSRIKYRSTNRPKSNRRCECSHCPKNNIFSPMHFLIKFKLALMIALSVATVYIYTNMNKYKQPAINNSMIESVQSTNVIKIIESLNKKIDNLEGEVSTIRQKLKETPKAVINLDESDFSSQSLGGLVLKVFAERMTWNVWKSLLYDSAADAQIILKPRALIVPGECWGFKGSEGIAIIKLIGHVLISGVTIEHIPVNASPTLEISTAPKKFALYGLDSESDTQGFYLGTFIYDAKGTSSQTFNVEFKSLKSHEIIKLMIFSNWGQYFTCLYRIKVHGRLDNEQDNTYGFV